MEVIRSVSQKPVFLGIGVRGIQKFFQPVKAEQFELFVTALAEKAYLLVDHPLHGVFAILELRKIERSAAELAKSRRRARGIKYREEHAGLSAPAESGIRLLHGGFERIYVRAGGKGVLHIRSPVDGKRWVAPIGIAVKTGAGGPALYTGQEEIAVEEIILYASVAADISRIRQKRIFVVPAVVGTVRVPGICQTKVFIPAHGGRLRHGGVSPQARRGQKKQYACKNKQKRNSPFH